MLGKLLGAGMYRKVELDGLASYAVFTLRVELLESPGT